MKTYGFLKSNEINTIVMSISVFTEERGQSLAAVRSLSLVTANKKKRLHVAGQEY